MKILVMPVQPQPRGIVIAQAQSANAAGEGHLPVARMAYAPMAGLSATLVLTCVVAGLLALALAVLAASVALVVFMAVSPEGNLLFLVLLSQVWLFYAPRKAEPGRQPDGGLTMKTQPCGLQAPQSLAA